MRKRRLVLLALVLCSFVSSPILADQPNTKRERAQIHIPDSSFEQEVDKGLRAHTNHVLVLNPHTASVRFNAALPPGENPNSIRPVYQLPSSGGSQVIAIVDAYDYPTAENDLNVFSSMFGLPPCTTANGCFQKVYAAGVKPKANCGWAQESALDIEWAHAMAPNAKIILVEAKSNSFTDLLKAVDVASSLVSPNGTGFGQVSMSWGGSEFSTEAGYDSHFKTPGVVYFAASGDTGGATIYPGVSANVVSAGGTTINRDSAGNFVSETGWSGSGGGPSKYESRPSYQNGIASIVGARRGVPDFSFDADPQSGVAVYDSTSCYGMSGWMVFGGTSVASPSLAGIVNTAGHFYASTSAELTAMYTDSQYSTDFRDILTGTAGKFSAMPGWDFVTGLGSNLGLLGK